MTTLYLGSMVGMITLFVPTIACLVLAYGSRHWLRREAVRSSRIATGLQPRTLVQRQLLDAHYTGIIGAFWANTGWTLAAALASFVLGALIPLAAGGLGYDPAAPLVGHLDALQLDTFLFGTILPLGFGVWVTVLYLTRMVRGLRRFRRGEPPAMRKA